MEDNKEFEIINPIKKVEYGVVETKEIEIRLSNATKENAIEEFTNMLEIMEQKGMKFFDVELIGKNTAGRI